MGKMGEVTSNPLYEQQGQTSDWLENMCRWVDCLLKWSWSHSVSWISAKPLYQSLSNVSKKFGLFYRADSRDSDFSVFGDFGVSGNDVRALKQTFSARRKSGFNWSDRRRTSRQYRNVFWILRSYNLSPPNRGSAASAESEVFEQVKCVRYLRGQEV